ncbi:MAG: beta-ketoacyl synthase N-terminal-like domain-containing protein [Flavobacteriaceae bacterium]
MKKAVYIEEIHTVSALGIEEAEKRKGYLSGQTALRFNDELDRFVGCIDNKYVLPSDSKYYSKLDRSVRLALTLSARMRQSCTRINGQIGVSLGSSRGATQLLEGDYKAFMNKEDVRQLSSPTTTMGNISSWVAQDLSAFGPNVENSMTCSTAAQSVLTAVAYLNSDMSAHFVAGGAEAALTPFTMAQLDRLGIYSKAESQAGNFDKLENTMVLGEGAGLLLLSNEPKNAKYAVKGVGYAIEPIVHPAALSSNGSCFQKAMTMAKGGHKIDAIVMHAPGTKQGDLAELKAIHKVFGKETPLLTNNKWIIGHTFGASMLLSLEMAIFMLEHQEFYAVNPHKSLGHQNVQLNTVLVNSAGFGGNAVSLLISKI